MIHIILIIISLKTLVSAIKQKEKASKRILIALLCFVWGVLSMVKDNFTLSAFPITLSVLVNIIICALAFALPHWRNYEESGQ